MRSEEGLVTKAKPPEMPERFLVGAKEGKTVWLGGVGVVFKLFGKDTQGAFSIVEHPIKPRTLVPPHMHEETDEFSFVVEGRIGARIGSQIIDATPGCYVLKPHGIPHTFWNSDDRPARIIEIISPAGFEQFFEDAAKLFGTGPPDVEKVGRFSRQYKAVLGWEEWIPELKAKYNLSLFGR